MGESVYREAFSEARKAVRLDNWFNIVLMVAGAILAALAAWLLTGQVAVTGAAGIVAALLLFAPFYLVKIGEVSTRRIAAAETRTSEAEARASDLQRKLDDQRDPDGVYQHGRKVGRSRVVAIDQSGGLLKFDEIATDTGFDTASPIEWRDYILSVVGSNQPGSIFQGGVPTFVRYREVVAKITGRRS